MEAKAALIFMRQAVSGEKEREHELTDCSS